MGGSTTANDQNTLVRLLQQNARLFGDRRPALRIKRLGIWQECSWTEYLNSARSFALGFSALGAVAGDNVGILTGNTPAALYAMIGASAAGCRPLCIHRDSTAAEVRELLVRFQVRFLVAEDQEQVDKVLEVTPLPASLKGIIYCNPRGMGRYRESILISVDSFRAAGDELETSAPGSFERMLTEGKCDETAVISTTSGCSGPLQGAMLSHSGLISMASALIKATGMKERDEYVSFLPFSWFGEQLITVAAALVCGITVNFPESQETVMGDLREIGPHIILAPPQFWEGISASVQVRMMESTPFKKFMFNRFMSMGRTVATEKLASGNTGIAGGFKAAIASIFLMRALKDRLGLSRVRVPLSCGSALSDDVFSFFHATGICLKQAYGMAESAGIVSIQSSDDIKPGTVGKPLPGSEISFSPRGEILLRCPGLFTGYFGQNELTGERVQEGWFHTGDSGRLDANGHLVVLDRSDDIFTTADGAVITPQLVEGALKHSPYISEALLLDAGRPFLAALVCINGRVTGKWAADNKVAFSSYSDLASRPEIYELITSELRKVNEKLPQNLKISRFTILYKELDPDDEELTRTGKLRREFVRKSFRDVIEALYSGVESMDIDRELELQDGRNVRIQSRIMFRDLG